MSLKRGFEFDFVIRYIIDGLILQEVRGGYLPEARQRPEQRSGEEGAQEMGSRRAQVPQILQQEDGAEGV